MPKIPFSLKDTFSQFSASQKAFLRNAAIAFLLWFPVADISFIHHILVRGLAENAALIVDWTTGTSPQTRGLINNLTGKCWWFVSDARGRIILGTNCDGWELYYLCAAFIIIFPGVAIKRKALFAVSGIAVMYFSNVLRIVALFFLSKHHPEWFQLFHKTIFQFIIYVIMFIVWIIYLQGNKSAVK